MPVQLVDEIWVIHWSIVARISQYSFIVTWIRRSGLITVLIIPASGLPICMFGSPRLGWLAPRTVVIYNGVNPLGQELSVGRLRQEYAGVRPPLEIAVRDRQEQPFVPCWNGS